MNPIVQKDIIDVLGKVILAVKDGDYASLSELSNHVIHDASIFQDDDSVSFAILVYALSKTLQRCIECGVELKKFGDILDGAFSAIKSGDDVLYRQKIQSLFTIIKSADDKLKLYIEEVIHKAKIKKGSKMHEHGLSVAKTSEILGIGQWELMGYIGKTWGFEAVADEDVKKRLGFARKLFAQ